MNTIRNTTYILFGATLLLSACTTDKDMPDGASDGGQIIFRTSFLEQTSRSAVITAHTLPYFRVTAFDTDNPERVSSGIFQPNFFNERVETSNGSNFFVSPACVWPEV